MNCPLVWDIGASFGLTPFEADFIDYVECRIPVNDIERTNIVVGIRTTLHRFECEGKLMYLPCLSYHFSSAEIHVFSLQTYHMLYGGHSTMFGDRVVMMIDHLSINIIIDREPGNVPMIHNMSCSSTEVKETGPLIGSALPH